MSNTRKAKLDSDKVIDNIMSTADVTSKKWWKVFKGMTKHQHNQNGPLLLNGKLYSDDKDKVDIFNNCFVSHSDLDTLSSSLPTNCKGSNTTIPPMIFLPEVVYNVLTNLDVEKATGPDGFGNRLLKEAAVPIARPLSELLKLGPFP